MSVEILPWLSGILEALNGLISLVKDKRQLARRELAQDLALLSDELQSIVARGNRIITALEALPKEPHSVFRGFAYQFGEPPLATLELAAVRPTPYDVESVLDLLAAQAEAVRRVQDFIKKAPFKNLAIYLQSFEDFSIILHTKFQTLAVLLSVSPMLPEQRSMAAQAKSFDLLTTAPISGDLTGDSTTEALRFAREPVKEYFSAEKTGTNPHSRLWSAARHVEFRVGDASPTGAEYVRWVVYSQREMCTARERLEQIQVMASELRSLVAEKFEIEEVL